MATNRPLPQSAQRPLARVPHLPTSWRQGEHVAVVGDTGSGKTFLMAKLVAMRKYVIILRTKPDDIKFPGFEVANTADYMEHWYADRILLKPRQRQGDQMRESYRALAHTWKHGSWTFVVDELWYAEHRLGLRNEIENLLTQGRSKHITMMVGMQRPSQVSRFAIAECTHLFVFRCEGRDAKTVAEASSPRMLPVINELTGHDFAYFNRPQRLVARGNANNLGAIFRNPPQNPLTP